MDMLTGGNSRHRRIAAIGMFDGVHRGHRFLIDFLKAEGERRGLTPTVVTFARHPLATVRPSECPPLLTTVDQKIELLRQAGIDDCVLLPFTDSLRRQSARQFLSRLKDQYAVDALVIGFNHSFGHDRLRGVEAYRAVGAEVGMEILEAPEFRGTAGAISSSLIRSLLGAERLDAANAALGHCFAIEGRVIEGNRLGRTLGYPTANIAPLSDEQIAPPAGVFAAYVTTEDGVRRRAMVNVGTRPTVGDQQDDNRIEAYILDYLGYLYDEKVTVEFVEHLRPERRFASLEKLKSQLAADEAAVRRLLK